MTMNSQTLTSLSSTMSREQEKYARDYIARCLERRNKADFQNFRQRVLDFLKGRIDGTWERAFTRTFEEYVVNEIVTKNRLKATVGLGKKFDLYAHLDHMRSFCERDFGVTPRYHGKIYREVVNHALATAGNLYSLNMYVNRMSLEGPRRPGVAPRGTVLMPPNLTSHALALPPGGTTIPKPHERPCSNTPAKPIKPRSPKAKGEIKPPTKSDDGGDDDLCVICWDRKRTHIFVPCGHFVVCEKCKRDPKLAHHMRLCPVCRTPASSIIKVY
jgi:hypothetical protein